MIRSRARLAVLTLPLIAGCTHLEYSQGRHDVTAVSLEDIPYSPTQSYELRLRSHEVSLLDTTGVVCASLGTGLEASNEYLKARDEAEKAGHSTFVYKYRQQSPSEYAGVQCGGYFRWGSATDGVHNFYDYDAPTYESEESWELMELSLPEARMREGGIHIGGVGYITPKAPALRWSLLWRLGGGKYHLTPMETSDPDLVQLSNVVDVDDDKAFFRSPFHVGLLFYPKYLLGLGGQIYGGMDPVGVLFTRDRGKAYQKFDYGARVGYTLTVKMLAFSLMGEWHHYNYAWSNFWNQEQGWSVGGSISLDPEQL